MTKLVKALGDKILVCADDCNYDIETHKGQHSWGCRFGTLAELIK